MGLTLGGRAQTAPVSIKPESDYGDIPQFSAPEWLIKKVSGHHRSQYTTTEKLTPYTNVTNYNNFYEFGYKKTDPAQNAKNFIADPWSVVVEGEVAKPGKYHLEDLLKSQDIEERIYRLRCVEAWSMVIPWVGFSLAAMIKRFEPTSKARFIEFTTLYESRADAGAAFQTQHH